MDRSGFPLSSTYRAREQDTCTSTPDDILHDSAARAKYTRTHDRVCPTTIIAVIGQMGERAQFDWQAGSVHCFAREVWMVTGLTFAFLICFEVFKNCHKWQVY